MIAKLSMGKEADVSAKLFSVEGSKHHLAHIKFRPTPLRGYIPLW